MITIKDLHFCFGEKKILNGLSLELKKGEIVSLIGLSGSGKTTLFRLISGLLKPSSGEIAIESALSYMREQDLLLPWRSVLHNLLLLGELGLKKAISREKALAILAKVGLKGYENHLPTELSKGMRQRVALARALLQNHPLLLLDEPFSSVDVVVREELYNLLKTDFKGKTILLITHDFRDALTLSDRIMILKEGRINHELLVNETCRNDPTIYQKIKAFIS